VSSAGLQIRREVTDQECCRVGLIALCVIFGFFGPLVALLAVFLSPTNGDSMVPAWLPAPADQTTFVFGGANSPMTYVTFISANCTSPCTVLMKLSIEAGFTQANVYTQGEEVGSRLVAPGKHYTFTLDESQGAFSGCDVSTGSCNITTVMWATETSFHGTFDIKTIPGESIPV
jgi:hypothetical protein